MPVVAASHDEDASLRFFRDNGEQHTRRTTTTTTTTAMPPPRDDDDDDEMVRTLARARTSRRASSPWSSSSPIVGFSVGKAPSAVGHQFAYALALVRHDANADSWVDIDGVVNGKGIVGYEGLYPATAMERFQLVVTRAGERRTTRRESRRDFLRERRLPCCCDRITADQSFS
jgi:hypothetical protein